ncbi:MULTISPECIES: phospholipase D-like domain-containing protein [unclassified Streptomyces]|uniref:phospholipase D-like domain-containing protein n=1 Tax=unclassified Streptomyces TaxID=2593676 RepID=UPI001F2E0F6F|nr:MULTISPECIES: phospholipase D-like domain-containing protein [unclassified Streptomyces]
MSQPRTRHPWPIAALVGTPGVRRLRAGHLITPPHEDARKLGEFGAALANVLARHVEVTGIDDETTFFSTFEDEIRKARASVWLWAPWVANRVRGILPQLHEAAGRGMRVTVFIRDDTDQLQARPDSQSLIADLRAVVHTVVPVNVMHQKIAVIDERTVMIGSLNTLSQSWTREVMVTMRGGHFARKLLEHEHAELFTRPPKCARCGGTRIELRRRTNGIWFWRCYDTVCNTGPNGRSNARDQDMRVDGGQELRDRTMHTPAQDSRTRWHSRHLLWQASACQQRGLARSQITSCASAKESADAPGPPACLSPHLSRSRHEPAAVFPAVPALDARAHHSEAQPCRHVPHRRISSS